MFQHCGNKCLHVSALQGASKSLFETLQEVYEPDWAGFEHIYTQSQSSDILWTDFVHKLQEQTMAPLHQYQAQFPELRVRFYKVFVTVTKS